MGSGYGGYGAGGNRVPNPGMPMNFHPNASPSFMTQQMAQNNIPLYNPMNFQSTDPRSRQVSTMNGGGSMAGGGMGSSMGARQQANVLDRSRSSSVFGGRF